MELIAVLYKQETNSDRIVEGNIQKLRWNGPRRIQSVTEFL
jgi:hypothetical protein